MKKIEIAMVWVASHGLLCAALGGWLPATVRAEAPTPKSGCWSREIVMRPMVDPQTVTKIEGRVIAIEQSNSQWLAPKEVATWLRVRTKTGEQKSIYLGSNQLLKQHNLKFKVGDKAIVRGFVMPKATKPTIVATEVVKGNRTWKIDNYTDQQVGAKSCRYTG